MVPQKGRKAFIKPFWCTKRSVKIKKLCHFSPLFRIGMTRVKIVFVEFLTYAIFIYLTIGIHKNRTWSIKTKLVSLLAHYSNSFSAPNFGILFIIIVLKYAPTYYQDPLPRYLIYSVSQSISEPPLSLEWKQEILLKDEMNFIENKHWLDLSVSCIELLHVTV